MSYLAYIVYVASFGLAFILLGYEDHARARGWPVGSVIRKHGDWWRLLALFTMIVALVLSFVRGNWWSPLTVALAGAVASFFVAQALQWRVQPIAALGTVLGFIAIHFVR